MIEHANMRYLGAAGPARSSRRALVAALASLLLATSGGCRSHDPFQFDPHSASYQPFVQQIEYPSREDSGLPEEWFQTQRPPSVRNQADLEPWPLTLEEAIELALQNSQVIRDLGGLVVSSPAAKRTVFDPALQETDPRSSVEAALSAFDAQLATSLLLRQNERKFNNLFFGGGTASLRQNVGDFNAEISKTTATGTRFAARNIVAYDRNTSPVNRFPSVYDTLFQLEFRHPLLQGTGLEFNRIAGPNASPGFYNGVLLARIDTDLSLADFEIGVRDLLRDVERAYWELYFAYRDLDAKQEARKFALETWQKQQGRMRAREGPPYEEALARQQFYSFQARLENALSGTTIGGTGLYTAERTLRRLIGLPPADGKLIRPASDPYMAEITFDWPESLQQAITRRAELRKQQWVVRRRRLELIAARNLQRPRLDLVGQYGWRGFGDDLLGRSEVPEGSAFRDLFTGDLQEWQLGVELSTPIGNRVGHLAVRHAELQVAREKALLREQQQHVAYQLADAFTELDRAYALIRSTYNSLAAAKEELYVRERREEAGTERLFFRLDAQQRVTDTEVAYHRSVVDYSLALLDLHYVRGTLLEQMQVHLAEGPWSEAAHEGAAGQSRRFGAPACIRLSEEPPAVSAGAYE